MIPADLQTCSFKEATHVEFPKGHVLPILEKYGLGPEGELAPPSKGGFGSITELGKVTMWQAQRYWKE